jgi:hypothetical protein
VEEEKKNTLLLEIAEGAEYSIVVNSSTVIRRRKQARQTDRRSFPVTSRATTVIVAALFHCINLQLHRPPSIINQ